MSILRSVLFLFAVLTVIHPSAAETHWLGLSGPLSGSGAGWGNDVKNVLIFANEKLAGGRYSFLFEDDRCDPKTSLAVARKLSAVDRVREVFVVCGQSVLATAKAYRDAGVAVMAPLATPSRISQLGIFRTSLSDASAAEMLARYIAAHHRSVAVLTEENDYPVSFLEDFLRSAAELKLEVSNENYIAEQRDFRAQLLRLKKIGVSALFLNTQTEEALANIVNQLKQIEFSPALYGAYLPGSEHFLEISGRVAEGMVFVDYPGAQELLNSEGRALYAEYVKRFGPLQGWSFAFPAVFESFRAVHLAISSDKPVNEYLRTAKFDGVFGPYSFNAAGDIVGLRHTMCMIRGGKSERLSDGSGKER